jgi:hypothetical protein
MEHAFDKFMKYIKSKIIRKFFISLNKESCSNCKYTTTSPLVHEVLVCDYCRFLIKMFDDKHTSIYPLFILINLYFILFVAIKKIIYIAIIPHIIRIFIIIVLNALIFFLHMLFFHFHFQNKAFGTESVQGKLTIFVLIDSCLALLVATDHLSIILGVIGSFIALIIYVVNVILAYFKIKSLFKTIGIFRIDKKLM